MMKPPFPSLNRLESLTRNCVAFWPFYEGAGKRLFEIITDLSTVKVFSSVPTWGSHTYGYYVTPTYPTGQIFLSVLPQYGFTTAQPFSLVCLFRLNTLGVGHALVNRRTATHVIYNYDLYVNSSNKLAFQMQSDSSNYMRVVGNTILTTATWYLGIFTKSAGTTTATMNLYVNAIPQTLTATAAGTVGSMVAVDVQTLFYETSLSGTGLRGDCSAAAIFNKVLTLDDIHRLQYDPFLILRTTPVLRKPTSTTPVISPSRGLYTTAQTVSIT